MEEFSRYVGLDVHKETIAVAMAYPGRSKPESVGVIAVGSMPPNRLRHLTFPSRLPTCSSDSINAFSRP